MGVKSTQLPVFINKVLLKHSPTHLLTPSLWLLPLYSGRVERWHKVKNIYYLVLYRKSLSNPNLENPEKQLNKKLFEQIEMTLVLLGGDKIELLYLFCLYHLER